MMKLLAGLLICAVAGASLAQQGESRVAKQARSKGAKLCVPTIDGMTKHLQDDDAYAFLDTWNEKTPDRNIYNSMQVRQYPGEGHAVSILSTTPSRNNTCDVAMTQVFLLPKQSCAVFREKNLSKWKFFGELAGVPVYEEGNPSENANIALIATEQGCLVVKNTTMFFPQ